jgi:hypothetical protein
MLRLISRQFSFGQLKNRMLRIAKIQGLLDFVKNSHAVISNGDRDGCRITRHTNCRRDRFRVVNDVVDHLRDTVSTDIQHIARRTNQIRFHVTKPNLVFRQPRNNLQFLLMAIQNLESIASSLGLSYGY